jgi:hypothetical protein
MTLANAITFVGKPFRHHYMAKSIYKENNQNINWTFDASSSNSLYASTAAFWAAFFSFRSSSARVRT